MRSFIFWAEGWRLNLNLNSIIMQITGISLLMNYIFRTLCHWPKDSKLFVAKILTPILMQTESTGKSSRSLKIFRGSCLQRQIASNFLESLNELFSLFDVDFQLMIP